MRLRKSLIILCLSVMWMPAIYAQQKPNIIFILADDLGSSELGSYGNTFNETPNLDQLAAEGMRFTQAYSAAPICSPARAGFITGQYPARIRITDFLDNEAPRYLDPAKYYTLNEALSSAGYRTGIIGKWHLDTKFSNPIGNPQQHGFDEVIGSETKYIADGDYFYPYDKISTFKTGSDNEYLTDRQCSEASGFIERNKDKPFFLYLSFYSVHTRLDAPEALVKKYRNKFDTKYGNGAAAKFYDDPKNQRHEGKHNDNPYLAAMIESIDNGVGSVMETLKKNGLDKNTLVVFFSDNGGVAGFANNGILRMGKSWLYEGGIRENLITRWPAAIKAGTVSDIPVCGIDFYPTFLEMAGIENKAGNIVDGKSILNVFKGNKWSEREALFWHYPSETGKWVPRMCSAVRMGNYKLLYFYADKKIELYDLSKDPSEKNDIAVSQPQKVKELKAALDNWKKEVKAEVPNINAIKAKKKKKP
ncbi:sulfatase [Niabella ginsengisoli]|uniref:Sulfatase n=1 Tax=Niabella ginsengisoli TaxID=522298 RepID=A0ABS9SKT2_9BACT|nr:sulfatase [Niabella ginsengisoli]MCH5598987.1 sulfatase [Niabella ginsengisoli]